MKKISILAVCLFGFIVGANAQVALGIKGGLNFANIDADEAFGDPDSKTGYHFGIFLEAGLGGINLQPELLFSAKGAEDVDLSYIEVPILLKKNFAKVLNVHFGPQFGFLTKAEGTSIEIVNGNATETKIDIKDQMKSADLSAVVGAGVNAPFGLTAGARYVFGLSDINDDGSDAKVTNKTVQIFVGWKFAGN